MISHQKRVIYVTRDIERALGLVPNSNYRVIANRTPYAERIKMEHPEFVTLLEPDNGKLRSTAELLSDPQTEDAIVSAQTDLVIVFKSTPRIEEIASSHGWKLLNPKASIAEKIENKISQVAWLSNAADTYLPPHKITKGRDIEWKGSPFIVQWAHGHTGDGTILVNSGSEVSELKAKFPERPARVTAFVNGPSFTVNAVVSPDKTLMGNINYQITGLPPFTDNAFSTVGNDWAIAHTLLSESEIRKVQTMVGVLGIRMQEAGWRGLFGVDFMRDMERDRLYLIEINARQPAGSVFESHLQSANRVHGVHGLTMAEAHVRALLGEMIDASLIEINDGAQVIQRLTKKIQRVTPETISSINGEGYTTVEYPNTDPNSDLLRIQSNKGIMESHGKLNARGRKIADIISRQ